MSSPAQLPKSQSIVGHCNAKGDNILDRLWKWNMPLLSTSAFNKAAHHEFTGGKEYLTSRVNNIHWLLSGAARAGWSEPRVFSKMSIDRRQRGPASLNLPFNGGHVGIVQVKTSRPKNNSWRSTIESHIRVLPVPYVSYSQRTSGKGAWCR